MFVIGNLLQSVAVILDKVLELYLMVIFIAVVISWVRPDPLNPIVQFLRSVTQPVFDWIRQKMPFTVVGMMDLSPMVAILLIWFAREFVVRTLVDVALRLR